MNKTIILSSIYFIASFIYTIVGFYSLSLNRKNRVNKVFFFLALSLSIWNVSFALMLNSKNIAVAFIFCKLAIIGWGGFYSLVLHFFYIIAKPEKKLSLKFYLLLYLPAIIGIILYIIPVYSDACFHMVQTNWGYASVDKRIVTMLYFNIYGFTFTLISLKQIYDWQKSFIDKKMKKITKLIFFAYVITILIVIYMNFFSSKALEYQGVRLISLWVSIPILPTIYVLIKNKTMVNLDSNDLDSVINKERLSDLLKLGGYMYIVTSFLNIYLHYQILNNKATIHIINSILMIALAFIHFFIEDILKSEKYKYNFVTISSMIMMTIVSIAYADVSSTTIWTIYFYYLITTMVFEKKKYAYAVSIYAILLQFALAFFNSNTIVQISTTHYYGRILIISLSFILASYINRIYRGRIKDIIKRTKMQATLNSISRKIIEIDTNNREEAVIDVLTDLSRNFNCNKAYLYNIDEYNNFELSYCKNCNPDGNDKSKITTLLNNGMIDESELLIPKEICVTNIEKLNLSKNINNYFKKSNSNSFYTIPADVDGKTKAVIIFEFMYDEVIIKNLKDYSSIIKNMAIIAIKRIEREQKLYENANFDSITKLKNKESLRIEVNERLEKKLDDRSTLLCIDIDNFKEINDAFGHTFGDKVLMNIANILREFTMNKYSIARFEADEFLVYLHDCYDENIISAKLDELFKIFEKSMKIDIYEYKLNISAGIARYPNDGSNFSYLLKNATLALHESKKLGKMRYHFCSKAEKETTFKKAIYTSKLVNSIENNELRLAFQAQMNLETNQVIGAESLIRWHSNDFGNIPPSTFIPILENTGMIIKIGEWIIEESVKEQIKLNKMGFDNIRISINLSAVQFQDPYLIDKIKLILEKYNVNPKLIEFEITESVATREKDSLLDDFNKIKSNSCTIALDDFGVEYSSLNRLQSLPIDRLKIDKSFVDGIGINSKKEAILKSILYLAKSLKLETIAEGVENKEQIEFLRELECDEIQGYYYAKPMYAEEFEEFVRNNNKL